MPTTASLLAFQKICAEDRFLSQKTMTDYFFEFWWSTELRIFIRCRLPMFTTEAELFCPSHELLVHFLGSAVEVGMAEFLPSSLPVWQLDHKATGDSPSLWMDENYPSWLS